MGHEKGLLLFIFCWCRLSSAFGQGDDYIFHHLKVEDGLTQATNAFVYKDSKGFVWISSITGLNRFDGVSVRRYTPDITDPGSMNGENVQSDFFEDEAGNIWFCTYEAIHRYDWKNDCFDQYQLQDSTGKPLTGYYTFHLDALQQLWFVHEHKALYTLHLSTGLFQFKGRVPHSTLRCYVKSRRNGTVERIYMKGQVWTGLQILDVTESETNHLTSFPGQPSILLDETVKMVIPTQDSFLWVLSSGALIRYHESDGQIKVQTIAGAEDMVALSDSTWLIGTQSSGLWEFNTRSWRFETRYTHNPKSRTSLLSNNVTYLYRDKDGTIWVSSQGVGLSYASPFKRKFSTTYLPMQSNPEREIHPMDFGVEGPGHMICFSRLDGVLDIWHTPDQLNIQQVRHAKWSFPGEVYRVRKYQDEPYWVATWGGIFRYDHQHQDLQQITRDTLKAYSIQSLPGLKMLFARSSGGIYEMRADGQSAFTIRPLEGFSIQQEYHPVWKDPKGRIWANENIQEFVVSDSLGQQVLARIPIPGFCFNMVLSLDSASYWIAGTRGLFRIDARSLALIQHYNDKHGLPAAGINSMLMDHDGGLWLAHANGIIFFDPDTEKIRHYGADDGLPGLEFTQAVCQLENGEMWFGAIGSITRFQPEHVRDIQNKAIPQISRLLFYDHLPDFPLACEISSATHITDIQRLCLRYKHNTLSFALNALEYSAPARNTVRYTMEGLDEAFIHTENGSLVRYPNMPPGDYRLVLYASNSDGVENPDPRILEIKILPPFHMTWWFYSLIALISISIIAYIVYLRFSKALELQKVRLRLYENLHDDVGSRLTAIALSAEELERSENYQNQKLTSIKQIARSIVSNMKRLVWAIDPENDRMSSIIQKINHDHTLILGEDMDFQLDTEPALKQLVVPGEIRYQMSSICSEAFNNIAKYAEATSVRVSITRENGFINLMIADNGKGFEPASKTRDQLAGSGYGLGNMKKRAARVKGTFDIRSQPGEGTQIEFKFPYR